ncbi:hypothetical protein [Oceanobacillus picturae]|uniref:hypothetical protein n=1 Tax=Oceanobacillus picturae TaxID=171693 RepID=UPI003638A03D
MPRRKISISFKKRFHEVYTYLEHLKDNNENVSDYICRLVEVDMNKEDKTDTLIQNEVRKVVMETLLSEKMVPPQLSNMVESSNEVNNRSEDIDLLNQLF